MIPVDREPGPWSKYLSREIQAVKDSGYKCKKCGEIFSNLPKLCRHSCPVELQEKIDNVRSRLGEADVYLPRGVDCIDSSLCVDSLESINVLRNMNSSVEVLDVRNYFDPVTWNPLDSIYRLIDILIMNTCFGKISVIHCFAGIDRSPFTACLYLGRISWTILLF